MSMKIWQDMQDALKEIRPALSADFQKCRDKASIVKFLDEHLPHPFRKSWEEELATRVPEILRLYFPRHID